VPVSSIRDWPAKTFCSVCCRLILALACGCDSETRQWSAGAYREHRDWRDGEAEAAVEEAGGQSAFLILIRARFLFFFFFFLTDAALAEKITHTWRRSLCG